MARVTARVTALALAAALAVPSLAAAGYRIVDEKGDTTLVSAGRLKMVSQPQDGKRADAEAMVLDVNRARLWMADRAKRAYWEGTVEEFCTGMKELIGAAFADMGQEMEQQMAEMQKAMAGMSKEERAQMAQMQKMMEQMAKSQPAAPKAAAPPAPRPPRKVTVQRTGETATIAGVATRKFRVLADGKPYEDLWLTNDPGLSRELNLERAPDTFGRMTACLFAVKGAAAPATDQDSVEDSVEYRRLYGEGWPMKVVSYHETENGAPKTTTFIGTLERRDIPDAEFRPPSGFRRAPFKDVFGGN